MSELSPEARVLIEIGRGADGPSAADKARVHAALMARLGSPPPGGEPGQGLGSGPGQGLDAGGMSTLAQASAAGSAAKATGLMSVLAAKIAAGVATVGVLGLGGYLLLREPAPTAAPEIAAAQETMETARPVEVAEPAPVAEMAEPEPAPTAETTEPAPVAEVIEPEPIRAATPDSDSEPAQEQSRPRVQPRGEQPSGQSNQPSEPVQAPRPGAAEAAASQESSPAPAAPMAVDADAVARLREEQALIGSAKRALDEGVPRRALIYLNQHGEQFPAGMLAEERAALKAIALCEAGEVAGQRERDRFLARWPTSPHAAAVVSACPR